MDSETLKHSKNILEENNLCNNCLGRLFPEIEAEDNQTRGKLIRKQLGLKYTTGCDVCNDLFNKVDDNLVDLVIDKINYLEVEFDTFIVGCRIDKNILEKDTLICESINPDIESIKKEVNREIGQKLENTLEQEVDFEAHQIDIILDLRKEKPSVRIEINPIYFEGRYLKLIRGIPQTRWPCRACKGRGCEKCNFTGKQYPESVEELISQKVLETTQGRSTKFHGAGREDIDVRMLGTGRPFVLEIKEPIKRHIDLKKLEQKINTHCKDKVEVIGLKNSYKSRKGEIKVSSPNTYKTYQALVQCQDTITNEDLKKLETLHIIQQRTPNRVSHRRADKIRTREVKKIETKLLNDKEFQLTITTEGGLYIKELISGDKNCEENNYSNKPVEDEGEYRSQPNISQILKTPSKCIQLDVIDVHK